ncbi:MAG: helix-turn-helix domain-containing protein [Sulfobacillus sp.]|nr:helix-turn-helix domain-containing protein [Sulfobacillus sp.]
MSPITSSHQIPITPTILIDLDQEVIQRHDRLIVLPARTWRLLRYLLDHPNRVVTDAELIAHMWPGEAYHTSADLYRHIYRIRQALEPDPRHPRFLLTRRERGYLFVGPTSKTPTPAADNSTKTVQERP